MILLLLPPLSFKSIVVTLKLGMNCETSFEQEMDGGASLEPDYFEFVEVDPTGRYGRVNN